jgi:chromosome segregation ATPase
VIDENLLLEVSGDIKSIIAKIENITEDIRDLSTKKNHHESRISLLEQKLPDNLDQRLREVELKTYVVSVIVPFIISLIMFVFEKLIENLYY